MYTDAVYIGIRKLPTKKVGVFQCPLFIRNPMTFHISKDKIVSHIDLSFDSIKDIFVKEIIIGSKANINDLDLELFLLSNGFNPLNINIHKSDIPYR